MQISISYAELNALVRNLSRHEDEATGVVASLPLSFAKGAGNSVRIGYDLQMAFIQKRIEVDLSLIGGEGNVLDVSLASADQSTKGVVTLFDGLLDLLQNGLALPIVTHGTGCMTVDLPNALRSVFDRMLRHQIAQGEIKTDAGIADCRKRYQMIITLFDPTVSDVTGLVCGEEEMHLQLTIK